MCLLAPSRTHTNTHTPSELCWLAAAEELLFFFETELRRPAFHEVWPSSRELLAATAAVAALTHLTDWLARPVLVMACCLLAAPPALSHSLSLARHWCALARLRRAAASPVGRLRRHFLLDYVESTNPSRESVPPWKVLDESSKRQNCYKIRKFSRKTPFQNDRKAKSNQFPPTFPNLNNENLVKFQPTFRRRPVSRGGAHSLARCE